VLLAVSRGKPTPQLGDQTEEEPERVLADAVPHLKSLNVHESIAPTTTAMVIDHIARPTVPGMVFNTAATSLTDTRLEDEKLLTDPSHQRGPHHVVSPGEAGSSSQPTGMCRPTHRQVPEPLHETRDLPDINQQQL